MWEITSNNITWQSKFWQRACQGRSNPEMRSNAILTQENQSKNQHWKVQHEAHTTWQGMNAKPRLKSYCPHVCVIGWCQLRKQVPGVAHWVLNASMTIFILRQQLKKTAVGLNPVNDGAHLHHARLRADLTWSWRSTPLFRFHWNISFAAIFMCRCVCAYVWLAKCQHLTSNTLLIYCKLYTVCLILNDAGDHISASTAVLSIHSHHSQPCLSWWQSKKSSYTKLFFNMQ